MIVWHATPWTHDYLPLRWLLRLAQGEFDYWRIVSVFCVRVSVVNH